LRRSAGDVEVILGQGWHTCDEKIRYIGAIEKARGRAERKQDVKAGAFWLVNPLFPVNGMIVRLLGAMVGLTLNATAEKNSLEVERLEVSDR